MSKTTIVWSSKSIPQRVLDVMRRSRRLRPWTLAELAPKVEASPGSTATALLRLSRKLLVSRTYQITKTGERWEYSITPAKRKAAKR